MDLTWDGDRLVTLRVRGATVSGAVIADPLLGPAHRIDTPRGSTTMSAVDWRRPTTIPAIAAPGILAGGAGTALMNALARLARDAQVPALRYAGPYPTPQLFRSLARSFRTTTTEAEFTADLLPRAATLARDPLPFDFTPAPSEHVVAGDDVFEIRNGYVDRVTIAGIAFERGTGFARIVEDALAGPGEPNRPDHAELWIGDAPIARVASFAPNGSFVDGPHPLPPSTSRVLGQAFPPALVGALAELVADAVPTPLADAARTYTSSHPLAWADLGGRLAAATPDGLRVHAALWDHIGPLGLARLALALAEALAPVVTTALIASLAQQAPLAPPAH